LGPFLPIVSELRPCQYAAMPRASDYLMQGFTYHLTQRCHSRHFLLKFARDRDVYRKWLQEGVKRHGVPVYGFCITNNHVHILAHADSVEAVSGLMHLASGSTAKQYNIRKERTGSMWEHPYQCTIVEDGRHLLNCLTYINLNMVRAGVVRHPAEWKWCGHDELLQRRMRYRILNVERLLESLGVGTERELGEWYTDAIERRIAEGRLGREGHWTESLAVGSQSFVGLTTQQYTNRGTFDVKAIDGPDEHVWAVREVRDPYSVV
jgi:putative transposase